MATGKRSGNRVADVSAERLAALNAGMAESATLMEGLAIDFATLLKSAVPEITAAAIQQMREAQTSGISKRMAFAADLIRDHVGPDAIDRLQQHPSDTVRGWTGYVIGGTAGLTLEERLAAIRPLADDKHFGVREWAWMAVRPYIAHELPSAITLLTNWTTDSSERIRRFASEVTRPRGVWCAHITELKRHPELGLPLLTPLRGDPAIYVQNSVGNWLNDASKDCPDWVETVCDRWQQESPLHATKKICQRALRSIRRQI